MSQEVDFYFTMIGFGLARKRTVSGYSGYTILVVDDQEETLISTQLLLQKEGHQVLTSASGEEAMTLFCPGKVALILVDYFMPGVSGETVVQEIRKRDEDVQIVLITGYAGEKPPREMLRQLDIQGYHDKTDGPERLLLWVDAALKAYTQLKTVRQAEQEVAISRAQLRFLSARLLQLQEEEREQISRELHDHFGQLLTAVMMAIEWVQYRCPKSLKALSDRLEDAIGLLQEGIQYTRQLSATMRPSVLKRLGLTSALQEYVTEFERRSSLSVKFSSDDIERMVAPGSAIHLYRIVQEALTNVARHAKATEVRIDLKHADQKLVVSVTDDGRGFDVKAVSDPHAVGLVGLEERAWIVGGTLEVHSILGEGTTVILEVPLTHSEGNCEEEPGSYM